MGYQWVGDVDGYDEPSGTCAPGPSEEFMILDMGWTTRPPARTLNPSSVQTGCRAGVSDVLYLTGSSLKFWSMLAR